MFDLIVVPIGSVQDFASIAEALKGAYGAFVNTDTWTLSAAEEVFAGLRIFELAKEAGTVRHYVWSGLDNVFKVRLPVEIHFFRSIDDQLTLPGM